MTPGPEGPIVGDVGVGLDERPAERPAGRPADRTVLAPPARWLTSAGLSWAAAGLATVLAAGNALLAAYGHDLSGFLVPIALGYAWMGGVLLARRPGHPMGPLLCLIGLANAVSGFVFAYARYTVVHAPGSLPFSTAALWANTWDYAPRAGCCRRGGGPRCGRRWPSSRCCSRAWPSSRRTWAATSITCRTPTPTPRSPRRPRRCRRWPWRAGWPPSARRRRV